MANKRGKILRIYDNVAVFENLETGSCLLSTQLKEGYRARDLQVWDRTQLADLHGSSQIIPFEVLFGIYDLLSGPYAAIVIDSELFFSVGNITMRKAKKILVVPMFRSGRPLSETKQRDENRYIELLHLAFAEHSFFFSLNSDITLSQQRLHQSQRQNSEPIWKRADDRFFWNREVIIDLIACEANEWIVPFMSAYVEVRPECEVEADKFTLLFISRRSRYRQGCRFTKRGVDENGHCANFVETEQILIFPDGKMTSFVQVRGSIPLKWSSPVLMKYEPPVYIEENKLISKEAAKQHILNELIENYVDESNNSEIVFVNLIDNKKDQGKLGVAFKEMVDYVQTKTPDMLHYIWFDYHHECKQKGKEKNLIKLVQQLAPYFPSQKYFCKLANGTVASYQKGVFRTNCMDNLDRTNVVQSFIAKRSLFLQLGKNSVYNNFQYSLESPYKKFEALFRAVWVNNADAMSFAYAGTGALKTDVVKKGKRSLKGMYKDGVNSMMRYYINNFKDGVKQDSIDLLLGNYRPDPLNPSPFTPRPKQESLSNFVTRAFVLLIVIFSFFLLVTSPEHIPIDTPEFIHESLLLRKMSLLSNNLILSMTITLILVMWLMYKVVKKGSKIGECLVCQPQLIREPIQLLP